jgi:outer membrane biosynthesis protein TonB
VLGDGRVRAFDRSIRRCGAAVLAVFLVVAVLAFGPSQPASAQDFLDSLFDDNVQRRQPMVRRKPPARQEAPSRRELQSKRELQPKREPQPKRELQSKREPPPKRELQSKRELQPRREPPPRRADAQTQAQTQVRAQVAPDRADRRPAPGKASASYGRGTVFCVRTCDGRYFPMQRHAGASTAEVCRSLCPAAKTIVFSGSNIEGAAAPNGTRYTHLDSAFAYRKKVVPNCTCNDKDEPGLARMEAASDPTLRPGDMVATSAGLATFNGKSRSAELKPVNPSSAEAARKLAATKVRPAPPDDKAEITASIGKKARPKPQPNSNAKPVSKPVSAPKPKPQPKPPMRRASR